MLINKLKIMFFTALCFIFISCTVDVNQPVRVEEKERIINMTHVDHD